MVVLLRVLSGFTSTQRPRFSLFSNEYRSSRQFLSIANSFWHQTLLLSSFSEDTHTHTHIHARTQQRDWLTAQGNVSCAAAPPSADMGAFRVTSHRRAHYELKPGSDFWEVKTFLLFEVHQVKVYLKLKNRKLCINIINNHHTSGC